MSNKIIRIITINPLRYLHVFYRRAITYTIYKASLIALGKNCLIGRPLFATNKYISIGNGVYIWPNCRIEGISKYQDETFSPQIIFDDFCTVQQNLHLTCAQKIYIGKNTAIAANVSITDIHHPYEDINTPIENQNILVKAVYIDDDCKIYNNVVILPGTYIGKHCTIGANSVVSGSFPDFSVAVGTPAKIIKRYNEALQKWMPTNPDGSFKN